MDLLPRAAAPARAAQAVPSANRATPQDGIDAGKVYERIKRLTLSLSERYGVETLLYWQPEQAVGEPERIWQDLGPAVRTWYGDNP